MLIRTGISIVLLFFAGTVNANVFDSLQDWSAWEGTWEQASAPGCSKSTSYEDPLFGLFMKKYEWEFTGDDQVIEKMQVEGCHAEISYKVEMLAPEEGDVGPAHMKQLRLTRQRIATNCLRHDARPKQFVVSYISYPDFFETFELIKTAEGPCQIGEGVIMQFRRQKQ